jgi:hypothetical protein
MPVTLREIAEAQERREALEEAYLVERGWKQTCETPGSLWAWTKQLSDGRIVLTTRLQALAFATAIEREQSAVSNDLDEWKGELNGETNRIDRRVA